MPKSDQKNSDDLIAGPITITITRVEIKGGQEQPVAIFHEGDDGKPYKPCKSMCRALVMCWGPDANKYVGRSMTLYRDPDVKWGGMAVGGIRISHLSHITGEKTMMLTATKGSRKPHKISPIVFETDPAALQAALSAISTMTDKASRDAAKALAGQLRGSDADQAKDAWGKRVAELQKGSDSTAA